MMSVSGRHLLRGALLLAMAGCRPSGAEPVELYPEDICSQCRMAVSDERFAGEIIDDRSEVFKFDDIGCMLSFRAAHPECGVAALFVKDYSTRQWVLYERAVVITTDIRTPMGSGMVAFADSGGARKFTQKRPAGAADEL